MTDIHLAAPTAPEELRQAFLAACARPTNIHQHLTVMRDTASGQPHITELGVGEGQSTLAWLLVQPDTLVCYDLGWQECVPALERLRGRTDFRFYAGSSLVVDIEPTDLLFIDTSHSYANLKAELARHADKVRNYIVLHDTTTFGDSGEDGSTPGLWAAVEELLYERPEWRLVHRHLHNNGLTILGRDKMGLLTLCKTLGWEDYGQLKDEVGRVEAARARFAGQHRFDHEHRAWEYGVCLQALGPAKSVPGKKVLDVGGGDSVLGGALALGGADVTVVDVSDYNERSVGMGCRYRRADFTHGIGETFDAVFCVSVIEHTERPDDFFKSLCAAVRPGGVLALTTDFHPSGAAQIGGHCKCFNAADLARYAQMAAADGFTAAGELDYSDRGAPIFGAYNFASLVLRRGQ